MFAPVKVNKKNDVEYYNGMYDFSSQWRYSINELNILNVR